MSRVVAAALFLALAVSPVLAQMRGGGGHMSPGFRGGFRGPAAGFHSGFRGPAAGFHGGFRGPAAGFHGGVGARGFGGSRVVFRGGFHSGFRPTHRFRFNRGFFGYPFGYYPYYPYYYDPFLWGSASYSNYGSSDEQQAYSQNQQLYNQLNDLSSDVRELKDQNEQLRYELEKRQNVLNQPQPSAAPEPQKNSEVSGPVTVIVFRDGRQVEVRNYAVVGQTLWILSDQRAQKVPLSQIDLDQTAKLNTERGVEFLAPSRK
jgi:regulator of replication initiation timing